VEKGKEKKNEIYKLKRKNKKSKEKGGKPK
jgi:hypothetical protein